MFDDFLIFFGMLFLLQIPLYVTWLCIKRNFVVGFIVFGFLSFCMCWVFYENYDLIFKVVMK